MKRFLVFGGVRFYAHGGFNDFVDSFDNLVEALECTAKKHMPNWGYDKRDMQELEWHHIFDQESGKIVSQSSWQAYGANENSFVPTIPR